MGELDESWFQQGVVDTGAGEEMRINVVLHSNDSSDVSAHTDRYPHESFELWGLVLVAAADNTASVANALLLL